MVHTTAHQEPYTKYPNRYNDVIKPQLTDTQRDICDVVIRMTYGWHQTSAAISNSVFIRKTNKTKQGIIKAKKQLEEIGILIVLEKGGGSKTSEYMLDLWYDDPDRSVKASIIRQEEQLEEMEDSLSEEQEDIPKSQVVELESYTPEAEDLDQEISDTGSVGNPCAIEDSEPPTGKLSLPPYKEDLNNNILSKKEKHTVTDSEDEKTKSEKKKATATVRYKFFSIFPETREKDDWQFFGWIAKEYGLDICLEKLNYMKEHYKQHEITNPKGFFRMALVKDYQLPAFILAKIKADENARREKELCQKESEEWREMTASFNYEGAMASLNQLLETLN